MGDERRSDTVKASPVTDDPVRARQADEAEADTSYANRQLAMRGRGKGDRAGFVEDEDVDHMFQGVGDQYDASAEMKRILDAGVPVAGLVEKVQKLDHVRREEVASRIDDVAKIASGNEVLQIADLVGLPVAKKIAAALGARTPATLGALRAHAMEISIEERVALLDEETRKLLEASFSNPGEVIPGIADLGPHVLKQKELVAWFVRTMQPKRLAHAMMRSRTIDDNEKIAAVFNDIGRDAWTWALQVDAQMAQLDWGGAPEMWAKLTNQPDVARHFEAFVPKNRNQKGRRPGGAKALQELVPEGTVDVAAVIAALNDARTYETYLKDVASLAKAPYRARLIANASLEQIEAILSVMTLDSNDMLEWYLDSPHATPEGLRPILSNWDESWIAGIASKPALLTKAMATFPAAGPSELFGGKARQLYPLALTKPAVRKWCTQNADPRELLFLVTQKSSSVSRMWKGILDDGVAADWYKGLGTGVGAANDERLRVLALNTPDRAAGQWIRHTLIGDYIEDKVSSAPEQVDAVAYERDARKRFDAGLASDETDDMGHRTSELSDEEIAKLRANPDELAKLLPRLHDPWLLRNLLRINPPLPIVLKHASIHADGLPSYVRTRPAEELVEAFRDDGIATRITQGVRAPFNVFPALRDASVLAKILARPETLTWLLKSSDVPYVISLLASDPVAGRAAAKVFESAHLALIPDVFARKQDQAALEKLAAFVPEFADQLRYKAEPAGDEEEEDDEAEDGQEAAAVPKARARSFEPRDLEARQGELEAALATGDLREGLDLVLKPPVQLQNVLAVCRELSSGAAKLVGKPEHEQTVKSLREAVSMTPLAVFPSIPYYAYFHTPASRQWLFQYESAADILRDVAHDPQLMQMIVDKLDANGTKAKSSDTVDTSIQTWLDNMPKGTALTEQERRLVKRLFQESRTNIAARKMFEIRFGTRMTTTFTKDELVKFWEMLELVPDAHIEMGAVHKFTESKTLGGYSGLYSAGDHRIDIEDNLINSNKTNLMFDQQTELTREQLMAAYGYDDMQIKAKVASQEIDEKKTAKGTRYVIKPVTTKLLDTTVLHEIGHAVDDMLGDRTELVYGLAEWREFGESDIEELAKDLGGWDRVTPADQSRIKDAWAVWLNSRTDDGIDRFVPANHPALADKYRGVGIVDLGRKKQPIGPHLGTMNGKLTIVNHKYQRFYRVPEKTRNAAPSSYSMTAPAEFFAECYAEYYREYAGPGTEAKKGGQLAGWIKGWFDQNIDNLKFNPSRGDR